MAFELAEMLKERDWLSSNKPVEAPVPLEGFIALCWMSHNI